MKKLMMMCVVMMACTGAGVSAPVVGAKNPMGYKPCSSDMSCDEDEYCGFVGVDTGAVCRSDNNIYPQVPRR